VISPPPFAVISHVAADLTTSNFEAGVAALAQASAAGQCQFIVSRLDPTAVVEIKNGGAEASTSAWIGSHAAFERYQEEIAALRAGGAVEMGLSQRAFSRVIEHGDIEGVGLLVVSVITTESGYEYAPSAGMTPGFTPQVVPSDEWTTVKFGGAHDGGFAYSFMGAKAAPAVGVYFPIGNVGVLSAPLSLEPTVSVRAETQGRFVRSVQETYGIALTPGLVIGSRADEV